MLDGLKLDFILAFILFFPSSDCCILMSKQASMHKAVQFLQYCNLLSHDNAANQPEIHICIMDCKEV